MSISAKYDNDIKANFINQIQGLGFQDPNLDSFEVIFKG
jgi:arginyl-tRNA--protein-N-Asp/Glu arginylyltransferase